MGWLNECKIVGIEKYREIARKAIEQSERHCAALKQIEAQQHEFLMELEEMAKKEETAMQVSYNGFTGELVKLERYDISYPPQSVGKHVYDLSIYDSEKRVTHSFTGVKLEDVKFLGGTVSFDG